MTVKNVLVIGGGVTGTVASIALAQKGVKVTLIEISPEWYGVGHGITVQGNALKVFQNIGALDRMLEHGLGFNDLNVKHADGHTLVHMEAPHTGGPDLPSTMGALRSDLQTVLVDMIHDLGVEVRLGTEMVSFVNKEDSVDVTFNNGTTENFDLVVAADGIKSKTRKMLGSKHDKQATGLGIWRVVTKRTPEMTSSAVFYEGPEYKAGYTPISEDLCYAYVLTDPVRPDNGLSNAQEMKRLLEGYHGEFDFIRENIQEDDYMNFQPIEWLFVDDEPWHQGRVIMVGDAVHACPPLIAQGAAQCSEDAYLLAEYVTREGDMETLLTEYTERRKPRVKIVVDASLQLVEWEIHPDTPGANPAKLMGESLGALTQPA
ncbi:FAD-dependent monooxygenase [Aurantimicrobium photophilum]|uniref:3-hydroxybenzoate 6-hydroxylase 1 n=1 Tax=Aurantimicrobium photophilum TaxID=1987356 RepID=A0A2Z3RUZ3_9MICO|nr:FAD-dependent monooxygenase [Aurantimicrobium photophilum]AWR20669.1 3-hydroxybenzoate 6-hydroxylase 1 [Aurantimicrobium photophilum]